MYLAVAFHGTEGHQALPKWPQRGFHSYFDFVRQLLRCFGRPLGCHFGGGSAVSDQKFSLSPYVAQ